MESFLLDLYQPLFSSIPFLVSLLLLFPPLLYALLLSLRKRPYALNLPPSPPKLPIIGNLHQLGKLPHRSLRSLSQKFGPLMLLHFGSFPTLVVSSADVIDEIIRKHDHTFSSRPHLKAVSVLLYRGRDVILSPYGDYWRQAKKICVVHLLNQNMVRVFQSIRDEEVAHMLKQIHVSCDNGSEIDFREISSTVTSNVIYKSATGRRSEERVRSMTYKEWMEKFKKLAEAFCFTDLFPFLAWMDNLTGFNANLDKTFVEIDEFLGQIIDDHMSGTDQQVSDKKDFVDIILHLQKDGMLDIDLARDDIKAIINGIFSAATDTVSVAMEWIMSELIKHPSVMKKAQDEIRNAVGETTDLITAADVNKMQYLKCVIKEAMRLHAFGLVPRETTKSVRLSGYDIPPKTRVLINVWSVNRDEKVWKNPDEFIPERFMESQVDFVGQHKGFIPFGFGRRSCPGWSYALALVENVIANVLYCFNWELPGGVPFEDLDMDEKFLLAINRKYPLRLVPKPRFPV